MFSSLKATKGFKLDEPRIPSHDLCVSCQMFQSNLLTPGFFVTYNTSELKSRAAVGDCKMCGLLWRTCQRNGVFHAPKIKFERVGPFLRLESHGLPVMTLVHSPGQDLAVSFDFQVGFVELPLAGDATHLAVIQHWLKDCDTSHTCRVTTDDERFELRSGKRLPTRLIDVGIQGDETVALRETGPEYSGDWVALSHSWGRSHFCTTRGNIQQHVAGLRIEDLPATFRDAVIVTRALGARYLFIDAMCIVHGSDGDTQTEFLRIGDIFRGAYCVIAANNATDHFSGFLKPRKPRDFVRLHQQDQNKGPFFICQNIDDFKGDVLDSALHRRAWILQEHALARRTIFFTKHQTYFECGGLVRCETSTEMSK